MELIPSQNDLVLGDFGIYFTVSGNTQINRINSFRWKDGQTIYLRFQEALVVKHNQTSSGLIKSVMLSNDEDIITDSKTTLILTLDNNAGGWLQNTVTNIELKTVIPPGAILAWSGTIASIPTGWAICDGTNGTPDLTDQFIRGAL
jgi:hypothetical protein